MRFNRIPKLADIAIVYSLTIFNAMGQPSSLPKRNEIGMQPTGSYQISDLEAINLSNGNVSFRVPIASMPPGRTGQPFQLGLNHNNKNWYIYGATGTESIGIASPAWQFNLFWTIEQSFQPASLNVNTCTGDGQFANYGVTLKSPDGASRAMRLRGQQEFIVNGIPQTKIRIDGKNEKALACKGDPLWMSGPLVYFSTDGTYLRLEVDVDQDANPTNNVFRLFFNDGRYISGTLQPKSAQLHTDRLGNYHSIESTFVSGIPSTRITDQFQRIILIQHLEAGDEDVVNAYGQLNRGIETRVAWEDGCNIIGQYDPAGGNPANGVAMPCNRRVKSILLAPELGLRGSDRLSYQFNYSPRWGELSKVILPSLSRVEYTYQQDGETGVVSPSRVLDDKISSKKIVHAATSGIATNPPDDVWTYSFSSGRSVVTDPAQGNQYNYFYPNDFGVTNYWYAGLVYKTVFPDKTIVEKQWVENVPFGLSSTGPQRGAYNPFALTELKTNATGNIGSTSEPEPAADDPSSLRRTEIDKNGNVLKVLEYDFNNSSVFARATTPATGSYWGDTLFGYRVSEMEYNLGAAIWSAAPVDSSNNYNALAGVVAPSPRNVLTRKSVFANVGGILVVQSRTDFSYLNPNSNAVVSTVRAWNNVPACGYVLPLDSCNSVSKSYTYDATRNYLLLSSTDANGHVRKIDYGNTNGYTIYPLRITEADQSAVARQTEMENYDFWTGQPGLTKDPQNNTQTVNSYDIFGRLTESTESSVSEPSYVRKSTSEYDSVRRFTATRRSLNQSTETNVVSVSRMDGLGRPAISQEILDGSFDYRSNATAGIRSTVEYENGSGFWRTKRSNPFVSGAEEGMGYTIEERDRSGRAGKSRHLGLSNDNCCGETVISYETNVLEGTSVGKREYRRVTDAAGKSTMSRLDAFGRLAAVIEDANGQKLVTKYTYDLLDNLIRVDQGDQVRKFTYDSLSRLLYSEQPEFRQDNNSAGEAFRYTYDGNGNIKTKSEKVPRGVSGSALVTTYNYDALNRITSISYNDGTPTVTYSYDQGANARGRLSSVSTAGVSVTSYTYDPFGRVRSSQQSMPALPGGTARVYNFQYEYNLADQLTKIVYPSGREMRYEYDNVLRSTAVTQVKGTGGAVNAKTYWQATTFHPHGEVNQASWGVLGATETNNVNRRLQLQKRRIERSGALLMDLEYGYGGAANNGNPLSQRILPVDETQNYTYDAMNRLSLASASGWSQGNGYDRYGNRWQSSWANSANVAAPGGTPTSNIYVETTNRRAGAATDYDSAGNLLLVDGITLGYDAENRQVSATRTTSVPVSAVYKYDGEGRRVETTVGALTTTFVYDAMGQLAAEYEGTSSGPAGPMQTRFLLSDALGSTRVSVNADGNDVRRFDYLPFGGELVTLNRTAALGYGAARPRMMFTGKERDTETGLDYFGARYLSGAQGRFLGPDGPLIDQSSGDPQSWNLYSYVRNNPLLFIDPDGRGCTVSGNSYTDNTDPGPDCRAVLAGDGKPGAFTINESYTYGGGYIIDGRGRQFAYPPTPEQTAIRDTTVQDLAVLRSPVDFLLAEFLPAGVSVGSVRRSKTVQGPIGPKPKRVSNKKHHPKSSSPEPADVESLFQKSIEDSTGTRWAKDSSGTIHRFSAPSNGETHWNGSTAGIDPIRMDKVPIEVRRALN